MKRPVAAVVLLAVGCAYGPRITRFGPAMGPHGVMTTFTADSGSTHTGELLEVQATGLLLALGSSLAFVSYEGLQSARFEGLTLKVGGRRPPDEKKLATLRLVSRYPQGLSPPLRQQLLEAHGQKEATPVW